MALKGLNQFKSYVEGVSKLPSKVDSIVNQELRKAIPQIDAQRDKNFSSQRDPYGKQWKSRKHSKPWPTLNKTGRLKNSFTTTVNQAKISFQNNAPYAGFHQNGTRKLARRLILPTNRKGLPVGWFKPIQKRILRRIRLEILGKKR